MRLVTIDAATCCGWAAGATRTMPRWGSKLFAGGSIGQLMSDFEVWFVRLIEEEKPDAVIFEAPFLPRIANLAVTRKLVGMTNTVEKVCYRRALRCREAGVLEISRFFLGPHFPRKRAEKKAATISMCKLYGIDVGTDDDAADALSLWFFGEAVYDKLGSSLRGGGGPLFLHQTNAPVAANNRGVVSPSDGGPKWPGIQRM